MNTTTVHYDASGYYRTDPLVQYDYGQKLIFKGFDLPSKYEVHFANCREGNSTISLGDETGVKIPDIYLQTGKTVYAWLFLHDTAKDGRTVFIIQIPVTKRASIYGGEPTPVQQDIIEQAIAELEAALRECETLEAKIDMIWEKLEPMFDGDTLILDGMGADDV